MTEVVHLLPRDIPPPRVPYKIVEHGEIRVEARLQAVRRSQGLGRMVIPLAEA